MTKLHELLAMTKSLSPTPSTSPCLSRIAALIVLPFLFLTLPLVAQEKPRLDLEGLLYLRYSYQLGTDSTLGTNAHGNNFDVDRAYLTLKGTLGHGLSSRVTTDIDQGRPNTNQLQLRLKYAYVAWQPEGSALTWKFGQIQTPMIDWLETLWGYRMQGTVAIDRTGYLVSSDFGLSMSGAWQDDGINLTAGIYNGEGYNARPGDQRKDAATRASVRLARSDVAGPTGGLRLTGYAHLGMANGGGTRQRFSGVLSWQSKQLTLGGEATLTRDSTTAASPETPGRVLSLYGTYTPPASPLTLLARFDQWDRDTDTESGVPDLTTNRQQRVIAGVAYRATPNLRLLLDADLASTRHGSPTNAFEASRRVVQFHTEVRF